MLVDLHRNDVGRVAKSAPFISAMSMTVERYKPVMHITSNVTGELRDGPDIPRRPARQFARRHRQRRAQKSAPCNHRVKSSRTRRGPTVAPRLSRFRRRYGHLHRPAHHCLAQTASSTSRPAPASLPIPSPRIRRNHEQSQGMLKAVKSPSRGFSAGESRAKFGLNSRGVMIVR